VGASHAVADVVTGYGLAAALRRMHVRLDRPIEGARVIIEGFGNVGAACALYLARAGARIVAIRDARSILRAPDGLDVSCVEQLIRGATDKLLPTNDARVQTATPVTTYDVAGDIFVCAAISGSLTRDVLDRLEATGVRVLACGANQPFSEAQLGSTRVAQFADRRFTIVPDILGNCGMARTFSYLMEEGATPESGAVLDAVEATITETVDEVVDRAGGADRALLAATYGLALDRVGAAAY
jgi:glutamate dehydrogenase (NAD(P)+)